MTTITKRVPMQGASGAVAASIGLRNWGGAWGGAWGWTWATSTLAVAASGASPAIDVTARISGAANENITKRI